MNKMDLGNTISNHETYHLKKLFSKDGNSSKVDLIFVDYKDNVERPALFPIVRTVESIIASDETLKKEYLSVLGMDSFKKACITFLLGKENYAIKENRVFGIQTISLTGALRITGEFVKSVLGYNILYLSTPFWANFGYIFEQLGFEVREHRYWSWSEKKLNIKWMLEDLKAAPENAVILLQVSGHNPTGCEPTPDEWIDIADVIEERKLFPIFACSYQGLVSGDFEEDVFALRYFVLRRFEFFCAYSLTRIFGLGQNRACCLICVMNNPSLLTGVQSHFITIIKAMYSNPPCHGAHLVTFILNNPRFYEVWKKQLRQVYEDIIQMRKKLRNAIEQLHTPGSWVHITEQKGVFCFLGMTEAQVNYMREKHHVYLMACSRISMRGVSTQNVNLISYAIHDAISNVK